MGFLQDLTETVQDVYAAPVVAAQDVLARGKSPAEAIERRAYDITDFGGQGAGSILRGGGGGGGGTPAAGGAGGYIPGTMYVDPSQLQGAGFTGITGAGAGPATGLADLYGQAAGSFYGDFGLSPKGGLTEAYTYDPTLIDPTQLEQMEAFDFDPLRAQALGDVRAQTGAALQGALTGQAAAGGLTAADRMALASTFNRQRMGAGADVLGQFGIAEAKNIWETSQANKEMLNQAYMQNLQTGNLAELENIKTLMQQEQMRGAVAQEMFEQDKRIRAGESLAGGGTPGGGFDPYASGTKATGPAPIAQPAPAPAPTPTRAGGGRKRAFKQALEV